MNANAAPLLGLFEKKIRFEVPLFQRQYVWNREHQWEPLWEDIARKFTEYVQGRRDAPVHFLGAMVLDQKQTPTTHVERRQVIDGQQRLTTFQIFLAALRDFCREHGAEDLARECERFTINKGMMADPESDRFKVWPTQLDRDQFADVLLAGSRAKLEEKHPVVRRKYARRPEPRPRMVEAYLYFHDELTSFFLGGDDEPAVGSAGTLEDRLAEAFSALQNALQVVVIDLETGDDPQVIFETLNARGQPLLPADLLRNYIFLRAARCGEPQEELYRTYWQRFDDEFWRTEVRQGRLARPRSDLFMQHFLASRQFQNISIKHLFVEYKHWIERAQPFATVEEELQTLAEKGAHFRRILDPDADDPVAPVATLLETFDLGTAYPMLFVLMEQNLCDEEWRRVTALLESYLVRRAVCGWTPKNYNQMFLSLAQKLHRDGASAENLTRFLSEMRGESREWPEDGVFRESWLRRNLYDALPAPRLVFLLRRINETFLAAKTESIQIASALTIEHLMPQGWRAHWPLADGSPGIPAEKLSDRPVDDPPAGATRRRDALLGTIGNLTLITQPLNSSISNSAWDVKRPQLMASSLLPINLPLANTPVWDEDAIAARGKELFSRAITIWAGPPRAGIGFEPRRTAQEPFAPVPLR